MGYVCIPLHVLESPEFIAMQLCDQKFLIDLYTLFHDCETFTIDLTKPTEYRQSKSANMSPKVLRLLKYGFIVISGEMKKTGKKNVRVFSFKYPCKQN
jgi:hypothetical protein